MHVHIHIYVYAYIYIETYIHIYTYTHPNIGGFIFIFVYAQMYVCVCVFYHLTQVVYIVIIYVPVAFESLGHHHRTQIRTADTDVYYLWHVVKHTYVCVSEAHMEREREQTHRCRYLLPISSSKTYIYTCE